MGITGIIVEFNPLHSGHKLIIDAAAEGGNTVVCVISGNFVQRGDTAVLPKQKRAELALRCGVDIVAEMPVLWSMSTAQNFALAGVWQLYNLGCDEIVFGSECGDIEKLKKTADILCSDEFHALAANEVKSGVTFATARQKAAAALGAEEALLSGANDNLGIEYIIAAKRLGISIGFRCIKRMGADHDSRLESESYVSASFIREKMLQGKIGYSERYMPKEIRGIISEDMLSDIKRIEPAVLALLRTKTPDELKSLPDISEGIENKLYFSINVATSLEELYNKVKTKRYTLARVRRLVLSAFIGADGKFFMTAPPYVRLLGFSKKGEAHLKNLKSLIPVVTRAAQIKQLDIDCQKIFETECRASDLYALSLAKPLECGLEYKTKLLKTECLK